MTDRGKIIDKVRKLLALSSSSNQHEAELAAQRASELLEQHQLSLSDVEIRDIDRSQIVKEEYTVEGQKMKLLWIVRLARAAAVLFDGEVVDYGTLHGTVFGFVGFPDDVVMMKSMFEHLYKSWFSIVNSDLRKVKMENGATLWEPRHTMMFKAGHGSEYANSLIYRCKTLAKQRKSNVGHTATGTALVLAKDTALKDFGKMDGWVRTRSHSSAGSDLGRQYGRVAGENIALGGALNRNTGARIARGPS